MKRSILYRNYASICQQYFDFLLRKKIPLTLSNNCLLQLKWINLHSKTIQITYKQYLFQPYLVSQFQPNKTR